MDFANITTVVSIIAIVFLAGEAVKATPLNNKWIPIICGVLGAALGVMGMYVIPDFPATNWMDAAAVGIASGFASTGVHQAVKQIKQ